MKINSVGIRPCQISNRFFGNAFKLNSSRYGDVYIGSNGQITKIDPDTLKPGETCEIINDDPITLLEEGIAKLKSSIQYGMESISDYSKRIDCFKKRPGMIELSRYQDYFKWLQEEGKNYLNGSVDEAHTLEYQSVVKKPEQSPNGLLYYILRNSRNMLDLLGYSGKEK